MTFEHIVCSIQSDATCDKFLKGFIETSTPVNVEVPIAAFGTGFFSPCFADKHNNPVLTVTLVSKSTFELGGTKSTEFNQLRKDIQTFTEDVSMTMDAVVKSVKENHLQLFQCCPHLVLAHVKSPSEAPASVCPQSFKQDTSVSMKCAIQVMESETPPIVPRTSQARNQLPNFPMTKRQITLLHSLHVVQCAVV